ncbi:MAG: hypothetical protein H5U40_05480, partial [Polyangiaceae bacterium]|nr:hypothetical protein [Polyangiaceae bacterium]
MATARKGRGPHKGEVSAERVVRRPKDERKQLPPDLEAFARSDERRLRRPMPRGPKLKDPRAVALVPGVSNRDARAVCDARVEKLRGFAREGATEALGDGLAEAIYLGLWRGRALTGFGVLVEDILDIRTDDAITLAEEAAFRARLPLEIFRPELVAAWFRAEAGLLEENHEARVSAQLSAAGEPMLAIAVSGARAADALHAIGRRMTPLVRDHQNDAPRGPRSRDSQGDDRGDDRGPRSRDSHGDDRGPR